VELKNEGVGEGYGMSGHSVVEVWLYAKEVEVGDELVVIEPLRGAWVVLMDEVVLGVNVSVMGTVIGIVITVVIVMFELPLVEEPMGWTVIFVKIADEDCHTGVVADDWPQ